MRFAASMFTLRSSAGRSGELDHDERYFRRP